MRHPVYVLLTTDYGVAKLLLHSPSPLSLIVVPLVFCVAEEDVVAVVVVVVVIVVDVVADDDCSCCC